MSQQPPQPVVSGKALMDEMRFILETLVDQERAGKPTRLGELRSMLKSNLSLDFADYFKFLKQFNYVRINRQDQSLEVTDKGRVVGERGANEELTKELKNHFAEQVQEEDEYLPMEDDEPAAAAPPQRETVPRIDPIPSREVRTPDPEGSRLREVPVRKAEPPPASSGGFGSGKQDRFEKPEPVALGKSGGKQDSKYTRYETIGSGGIGTVFKGRHNTLSVEVAIKEIKDLFTYFNFLQRSEVVRNLRDVVSQMAALSHPCIVKIIDQNVEVAHPYFVMEYVPGGNLRELMAKGPIGIERSMVLFTQLCYGLRAAHRQGVIHGDIKPENILFDPQGNIRLTDFGMTRLLQADTDKPMPQVVTGSLGYLSPEQMKDRSLLTVASDIYSLGILLYEILTGNLPGRRSPLPSEINKEVPKRIDDLFDRMTRDLPEARYPDIDGLLADFYEHFKNGAFLSMDRVILHTPATVTTPPPSDSSAEA